MSFCPNCNKQFEDGVKFCDVCGTALAEAAPVAPEVAPAAPAFKLPFELNKKFIAIGAAALAAILVIAIVVSALFTPVHSYVLYAKEDEMWYYDGSGKPWRVAEDTEDKYFEDDYVVTTANGKRMYFIQDGDLYYRDVESKKEAVKIHSKVDNFIINEDGTELVYVRNEKLYRSNGKKEGEEIADDVSYMTAFTKDLKKILYVTCEEKEIEENGEVRTEEVYDVFLCTGKKTMEVAKSVSSWASNEDLSVIYYVKNGDLFSKKGKRDAVEIDKDVSQISRVYDGFIYYNKVEVEETKNEYGYVDRKETRTLCYYDGKKTGDFGENTYIVSAAKEKPVIVYASRVETEDEEGYTKYEYEYSVATKADSMDVDMEIEQVRFDENGKKFYALESLSEEERKNLKEDERQTTTLYEFKISGKKIESKSIDSDVDVYFGLNYNAKADFVWYYKDYEKEDESATLFINGKEVKDGVRGNVYFNTKTKTFVFRTDYETDQETGTTTYTLWFSKGGKEAVMVGEEVSDFDIQYNGYIAYIKDMKNGEGDLYFNKLSKNSKMIDTDVQYVIKGQCITEIFEEYF